jgi:effector-binding domain-containing protein
MPYEVRESHQPLRHLAVVRFTAPAAEIPRHMGEAFGAVAGYLARVAVPIAGPAIAYYEPVTGGFTVSAGFQVPSAIDGDGHVVPFELPACEAAVTTHMGSYDRLPDAYAAIQAWIAAHDLTARWGDTMWEEYWSEPSTPAAQTRTDVFWPVTSRGARNGPGPDGDRPGAE